MGPVWRHGGEDNIVVLRSVPGLPSALLLQWDPAMPHKSLYLLFVFSPYPSEDWKGKLLVVWILGYSVCQEGAEHYFLPGVSSSY